MKVRIRESFSGYPDGKKRRDFVADEVADVPDEFGKLIISKGHAEAASENKVTEKEVKRGTEKAQG